MAQPELIDTDSSR